MEQTAYLVMVNPGANNNKFYRMIAQGRNFVAEYGRVGANPQRKIYPMERWFDIYNQKIRKGYTDQTHLHTAAVVTVQNGYKEIEDAAIRELVNILLRTSRQVVKENYKVLSDEVTEAMVREAKRILFGFHSDMSKREFNEQLIELFSVIPRRMPEVAPYLAASNEPEEYRKIIEREQKLLEVMAGQVYTHAMAAKDEKDESGVQKTILESMGISIRPCTEKENAEIISHLTPESAMHFDKAFRVYNERTAKALDEYMEREHIHKARFLYHGSATCNYWNILTMGLDINPNAAIVAKMFGKGTYFATRARKSLRYTDLPNQNNLRRASSTHSFLSVFKVAYKKAYDIHKWTDVHKTFTYDKVKALGCDAVFAHKGVSLTNDEIIVYQNCQSTPHYLIALK